MRWSLAVVLVGVRLFGEEPALLWTSRFDRSGGVDNATGMQIDAGGNVYVVGSSRAAANESSDFLIIKYSRTGAPVWTNLFDLDNHNDIAISTAIDPDGVIYVTGESRVSWTNSAFLTVAFDGGGKHLWTRTYQALPDLIHRPASIGRDREGNIVVAGTAFTAPAQWNFFTIKYDRAGKTLWSQAYVGPRNADMAQTMKIDHAGNIYVLGDSGGHLTGRDFATVKYSPDGTLLWVARYNDPLDRGDYPADLAIDSSGCAVVVGFTEKGTPSADYVTLKYDANGRELWVRFFNGPLGGVGRVDQARYVGVGPDNTIYVTGLSEGLGGIGFVTIKYDPEGNQKWEHRFPPAGGDTSNYPSGLAVDASGNAYVTGYSAIYGEGRAEFTTLKYDALGNLIWTLRSPARSSGVGMAGMIVVAPSDLFLAGSSIVADSGLDIVLSRYTLRPPVDIRRSDRELTVSWPVRDDAILEVNDSVELVANWRTWSRSILVTNNHSFVRDPITTTNRFYRLRLN